MILYIISKKMNILHILNQNDFTIPNINNKLFNYRQIYNTFRFVSNILKILNTKDKFIIFYQIYIDEIFKNGIKYKLENLIKKIEQLKLDFSNVKIIYITNITDNILPYSKNINVLNVFLSNINIYSKLKDNTYILNKSYFTQAPCKKIIQYIVSKPKIKYNNVSLYQDNYRFTILKNFKNNTNPFKFIFINTDNIFKWLLNYIYETKIIGFGRIKQFGGTCWFNCIINGMLLSDNYKKILKDVYDCRLELMNDRKIEQFKNISLMDIESKHVNLKYSLMKLIQTIIIDKKNINENYEDFVNYISSLVKLEYTNHPKRYIDKKSIEDFIYGGCVLSAMNVIYDTLYPEGFHIFSDYYKPIIKNHEYDPIIITYTINNIELNKINDKLYIFDAVYLLENCTLLIDNRHSICGFKTEKNEYYIYDSNGIILKIDWRNLINFNDFMFLNGYRKISFITISFCVQR
jgi:hypothetical protein